MAREQIHCEWCQEPTAEIGDCGYCHHCCESRCTHTGCDCFAEAAASSRS